jgi:hypothetical protein
MYQGAGHLPAARSGRLAGRLGLAIAQTPPGCRVAEIDDELADCRCVQRELSIMTNPADADRLFGAIRFWDGVFDMKRRHAWRGRSCRATEGGTKHERLWRSWTGVLLALPRIAEFAS